MIWTSLKLTETECSKRLTRVLSGSKRSGASHDLMHVTIYTSSYGC